MSSLQFSGDTRSVSIRTPLSESSRFASDTASAITAPFFADSGLRCGDELEEPRGVDVGRADGHRQFESFELAEKLRVVLDRVVDEQVTDAAYSAVRPQM